MGRVIPFDAEEVQLVLNDRRSDVLEGRVVEQVEQVALITHLQAVVGEDGFDEGFGEGAKFDEGAGGISESVALGEPAKVSEFAVAGAEEFKILRGHDTISLNRPLEGGGVA